ncbi:MAG: DUF465 domain-containing protein [Alphaproteobacteria bacterium]|nr:DUF465 domain-containing protein [Alphaproteobacteria bacterium]
MDDDFEKLKQQDILRAKLEALTLEHRDLDDVISVIAASRSIDMLKMQRLKKRKLSIKDEIRSIHAQLLPDIIA